MGIVTAILSVLGAIFSAVCSAVAAVVKVIPWWVWVGGGLVLIGVWLGHRASGGIGMPSGCSCRELMCGRKPRPPKPPKSITMTVLSVPTGASIEAATGRQNRYKHPTTVTLKGVAAPVDGPLAEQSRVNLERMAGKTIRVEMERHGLFSSDAHTSLRRQEDAVGGATAEAPPGAQDEADEGVQARGPLVCVDYGESGLCLNTEQLAMGMAKLLPDGPKEWRRFEAGAKKQK